MFDLTADDGDRCIRSLATVSPHNLFNKMSNRICSRMLNFSSLFELISFFVACKRKEDEKDYDKVNMQKKPRLVFTDLQRRTLHAIFKENKRPSKEMQVGKSIVKNNQ